MVVIVIAILLSNTIVALIAIAIAIVGLFFLVRDWRTEAASRDISDTNDPRAGEDGQDDARNTSALQPELFEPDVSYEEAVESADDIDDFDLERESRSGSEK